jgi:PKHD-type hydroxylase
MQALGKHPLFNAAALPMRLRAPIFSRYRPGMSYGLHVDDALMGGANPVRTDLALTLFLSDPADYDGGELVIESGGLAQGWKLPAGDAILYPANTLHRVAEVTRGERHAAILWVQSHVRGPPQPLGAGRAQTHAGFRAAGEDLFESAAPVGRGMNAATAQGANSSARA